MSIQSSLERWRAELARLQAVDAWISAGKPSTHAVLASLLTPYDRLKAQDAKQALKVAREQAAKDAFIRIFSAFELEFRNAFRLWLADRCSSVGGQELNEALPESIRSLLRLAAALNAGFAKPQHGYVGNVMDVRNGLVHGGFERPMPYDLEDVAAKLAAIVAVFRMRAAGSAE